MAVQILGQAAQLTELVSLPLYGSCVPAGFPSPADDFIEDWTDLNKLFIKQPEATYFVRACGDSMTDAGIEAGDLLVVDSALAAEPKDGQSWWCRCSQPLCFGRSITSYLGRNPQKLKVRAKLRKSVGLPTE